MEDLVQPIACLYQGGGGGGAGPSPPDAEKHEL